MIIVQDRIEIVSADVLRLQQLFRERYRPTAEQRGLHFVDSLIAPPLLLQNGVSTLCQRWRVADVGAWWAMRAQSNNPAVAAFWAEVDSFCLSRERIYLADSESVPAEPTDISAFEGTTRGYRETAQLALREDVSDTDRAELEALLRQAESELPGLEMACLGNNLAPDYAAGHYTWDLLYNDQAVAEKARGNDYWKRAEQILERYCGARHALALETIGAGLRAPQLANAIKRTAYFRLLPEVSADLALRFEKDLLEMPAHIPEIRNWRLSRATPLPWNAADVEPWTYVWEQEFESIDALTGPYMMHPHHWAHIDRWFDPESGAQAVDAKLSHAFSSLTESLLTREVIGGAVGAGFS